MGAEMDLRLENVTRGSQAGYDAGRSAVPVLAVLLVVIFLVAVARKRRKSSAPAAAGARR